jgi:prepilin-type N-terminal cleavage/methylation domain-containing protein
MKYRHGFTLIEIMVSLAVFGIVMATMGSAFYKTFKDWQRQRDYGSVLENARWAMEFMSHEIRMGRNNTTASNTFRDAGEYSLSDHELLNFLVDPTGNGAPNKRIYYFMGDSTFGGDPNVLYRSQVTSAQDLSIADDVAVRKELCRFVVNGTEIFNVSSGCTTGNCSVVINLTVRPKPDQPEGPGNRNYSYRTLVRPRN